MATRVSQLQRADRFELWQQANSEQTDHHEKSVR
jgi:hypothetical protein